MLRYEYKQRGSCGSSSLTTCLSARRGSISAWCLQLHQAPSLFQLARDPSTFFAVNQATNDLTCARNIRRYDQRNIRTACRARPVTTPTGHPSSTHQTTSPQAKGSAAPGAAGQDGPNLETGALPCPGRRRCCGFHRERFRVCWKRTSKAHARKPKISRRVDHVAEGDGSTQPPSSELSACVASCSSWICGCVNERSRSL
jgi:hypothetical protein